MKSLASCEPLGLADLVHSLGGWPNLMQGLGSNLVAGLLAGLVAWIILRRTRRNESRLADELDARSAARELMATLTTVGSEMSKIRKTKDKTELGHVSLRVVSQILTHRAAIELADEKFVEKRLQPFLTEIAEGAKALATAPDPFASQWNGVAQAYAKNIGNTNAVLAAWLGARSKSRWTRWKRVGRGATAVSAEVSDTASATPASVRTAEESSRD